MIALSHTYVGQAQEEERPEETLMNEHSGKVR